MFSFLNRRLRLTVSLETFNDAHHLLIGDKARFAERAHHRVLMREIFHLGGKIECPIE